jgi:hypothetical protein
MAKSALCFSIVPAQHHRSTSGFSCFSYFFLVSLTAEPSRLPLPQQRLLSDSGTKEKSYVIQS